MQVRPEFDVTLAYNPESVLVPVARVEGIGWTLLSAGSRPGGSLVGGQGGAGAAGRQPGPGGPARAVRHARRRAAPTSAAARARRSGCCSTSWSTRRAAASRRTRTFALLTPAGRATLAKYLGGGGRVLVRVHRAADIRQLLRWAKQRERARRASSAAAEGLEGGAAARRGRTCRCSSTRWPTCRPISTRSARPWRTPPGCTRPGSRCRFFQGGDASHNARKLRQLAGNAVANGLPWEAALAGLTSVPAAALARATDIGRPSRSASAPTWCCGAATRWTWPAWPGSCGWTAARSRCAAARPSCATATCAPRARPKKASCRAPIRPTHADADWSPRPGPPGADATRER